MSNSTLLCMKVVCILKANNLVDRQMSTERFVICSLPLSYLRLVDSTIFGAEQNVLLEYHVLVSMCLKR